MLLIFPPLAKACEPPAGVARLAAVLKAHDLPCTVLDANLEGQLWLLSQPVVATDTWSRRAAKNCQANLAALRDLRTYTVPDRYRRAVSDLNRVLTMSAVGAGATVGLADFQHTHLSPLRSADLIRAAEAHEQSPFYPYFSQRLPELLEKSSVVGLSLNYLSQALSTFAIIGYIRKQYPAHTIIMGGGLVTSWLNKPGWQSPFAGLVDHLVAGAGEAELLAYAGKRGIQPAPVAPEYGILPLHDYFAPGLILPYSPGSGCYWNHCSFCPEHAEGNRYQPLPLTVVRTELEQLRTQTNPQLLHLLDNAISPALLRSFAAEPPGMPWYGFVRIDEQLADLDFCHRLRRSGCLMLKVGLESGDQGVLERMGKGINLVIAARVLNNLRSAGIAVYCYLLFGTPGETVVEARKTLEFVVAHHQAITFLNLAVFNMPLHSEEAARYGDQLFYEGDLSLYTSFHHPAGWQRNQVRQFVEGEFKRHPAVAAIVRNDPPQFTSNHAPFLLRIR